MRNYVKNKCILLNLFFCVCQFEASEGVSRPLRLDSGGEEGRGALRRQSGEGGAGGIPFFLKKNGVLLFILCLIVAVQVWPRVFVFVVLLPLLQAADFVSAGGGNCGEMPVYFYYF